MRAGLKYTITHTGISELPSAGGIKMASNVSSSTIDSLAIHDTDANGNDISSIMTLFGTNGGFVQVLKEDGTELLIAAVDASETSTATFSSDVLAIFDVNGIEVDTTPSVGDNVFVNIIPNLVNAVQTVGGFQGNIIIHKGLTAELIAGVGYVGVDDRAIKFQSYGSGGLVEGITFSDGSNQLTAAKTDLNVATFTISSKSAIGTGAKTNSLHRLPYDATLTGIEVIGNKTGGFSAGVMIAGGVLGHPTVGAITGSTLGLAGATGTSTTIESGLSSAALTGGNFLYVQVFDNTAGCTNAQLFASYTRR